MWGGNVSDGQTKRNLFWFVIVAVLATFYGCVHLQWIAAHDDPDPITRGP